LHEFYQPVILRSIPWQFKYRPTPPQTSQENSILHANVLSVTQTLEVSNIGVSFPARATLQESEFGGVTEKNVMETEGFFVARPMERWKLQY
jgi:hypothetical protein